MFPEFWTKYPNIPALVRFLKAYLARQDHFQSLLQQNISEVLKRFESTLNSRKTEGMAFDLLGALFAHLPLHMYQGQLDTVFKVALTALMSRKSEIRLKKHFVLAMSIFVVLLWFRFYINWFCKRSILHDQRFDPALVALTSRKAKFFTDRC